MVTYSFVNTTHIYDCYQPKETSFVQMIFYW
jgi:hypothetical protein